MGKKIILVLSGIVLVLIITGCTAFSTDSRQDAGQDTSDVVMIGNRLTVHNTDKRLSLISNMDALSADGLYYASWSAGEAQPFENADGETVDLYDAQLHLLASECTDPKTAEKNMNEWLESGRSNYDVSTEETLVCNDQSYTVITYRFKSENPYPNGISAFGTNENLAVCIELRCREDYDVNLSEMLSAFLNSCKYQ